MEVTSRFGQESYAASHRTVNFGLGRPCYMVSGTRDNPPRRQLYRAFIWENVDSVSRVKIDLA